MNRRFFVFILFLAGVFFFTPRHHVFAEGDFILGHLLYPLYIAEIWEGPNAADLVTVDANIEKETLAKSLTQARKYVAAAKLYGELVNEFPGKPEYLYAQAENLIAANQTDDARCALVKLTSRHYQFIPGHLLYALYLEQVLGRPDDAENVMDEMVEANLQFAPAYARRCMYRLEHKNPDGAYEDLEHALDIDPDCVETLTAAANYYLYKKDLPKARAFLEKLPPESRDNDDVSTLRIRQADAEGKTEEAIELLRCKLAKHDNFILRVQLFDRLVATRRLDEAREEIAYLKKMRMSMEIIGFFESAIDIIEENWKPAVKKLELARSLFASHPETVAYVDRQLALCYGKLGQTDKQLDAFARAIDNTPPAEILPISIAYILALNAAGKTERLKAAIRDLEAKVGTEAVMKVPQLRAIKIALKMRDEAVKENPEELEVIFDRTTVKPDSQEGILIAARYLLKQGKADEARKILKDAIKKDPEFIGYVSYLALVEAQDKNYKEAISVLDGETRRRGEENAGQLIIKTRIAAQMPKDDAAPALRSVEEAIQKLPKNQRTAVLRQLGPAWVMIGDSENAKRIFEMLAEMEPDDVTVKVQLFDLARKTGDEPEMKRQTELIKKSAGANSAEYRYAQAAKIIWLFAQNKATIAQLTEAKTLLTAAEELRPEWANIPRARAELALLSGDYAETITQLQRVDELGALTAQQLELLVKLLYREGRDSEVKELMKRKQGMLMTPETERIQEEVENPDEITSGGHYKMNNHSPVDYLWLGKLAMRAKDYRKAEEYFRKTTELAPQNPDGWIELVRAIKAQEE